MHFSLINYPLKKIGDQQRGPCLPKEEWERLSGKDAKNRAMRSDERKLYSPVHNGVGEGEHERLQKQVCAQTLKNSVTQDINSLKDKNILIH